MAAPKPVRDEIRTTQRSSRGTPTGPSRRRSANELSCAMGQATVRRFSDGEMHLQIQENVRGADVFVVQPTCTPADRHLMELLLMMDALKRASARAHHGSVTLLWVRPAGPERPAEDADLGKIGGQVAGNRRSEPGSRAGSARRSDSGFLRHSGRSLFATPVMIEYFDSLRGRDLTVVSPDAGGVERARAFAKRLDAPLAIIDKRREEVNVAEVMHIIGEVEGQALPDSGRPDRHGGNAGEGRRGVACSRGAPACGPARPTRCLSGPAVERIRGFGRSRKW